MFEYAKPKPKQKSKKAIQKKEEVTPNLTGIPNGLKMRFENLSGFSFDDVRVKYNSDKPAQLHALAYTQGNQVHIGPGQEKHLGHELGHVVQQRQGRVNPTSYIGAIKLNDNAVLEKEADSISAMTSVPASGKLIRRQAVGSEILQRFTVVTQTLQFTNVMQFLTPMLGKFPALASLLQLQNLHDMGIVDLTTFSFDGAVGIDLGVGVVGRARHLIDTAAQQIFQRATQQYVDNPSLFATFFYTYLGYMPDEMKKKSTAQAELHTKIEELLPGGAALAIAERIGIELLAALIFHHDYNREEFGSAEGEDRAEDTDIDPTDITVAFNQGASCVITALFYAEDRTVFGRASVGDLHSYLVGNFTRHKDTNDTYLAPEKSGDASNITHNVWKNYSDDHVYPSLYAYFGYTRATPGTTLNVAAGPGGYLITSGKKNGMISVAGHMLYFQRYTDADDKAAIHLIDNESGWPVSQLKTAGRLGVYGAAAVLEVWTK